MTTMPSTPSPAEFLAGPSYDEDDLDHMDPSDHTPLDRLADLEQRVSRLEKVWRLDDASRWSAIPKTGYVVETPAFAAIEAASETEEPAGGDYYEELRFVSEQYADLEAKHGTVLALIEEIRGIVKPSTSKVSLAVKAAIDAWADPQVPAGEPDEPEVPGEPENPSTEESNGSPYDACSISQTAERGAWICSRGRGHDGPHRAFRDSELMAEWDRLSSGPSAEGGSPAGAPAADASVEEWRAYARILGYQLRADVDTMNRSQIRTMLGIEQPVGA